MQVTYMDFNVINAKSLSLCRLHLQQKVTVKSMKSPYNK